MKSHEETLRLLAGIHESKAQRMGFSNSEHAAACLAGADALRRGTCGTCKHSEPVVEGDHSILICKNDDALGSFNDRDWSVDPDDGCIKGYAPTEPTR